MPESVRPGTTHHDSGLWIASTPSVPAKSATRKIERAVCEVFSFKPAAIIKQLNLLRPIYSKTTNYGHFGKTDPEITWEKPDKIEASESGREVPWLSPPRRLRKRPLLVNGRAGARVQSVRKLTLDCSLQPSLNTMPTLTKSNGKKTASTNAEAAPVTITKLKISH